MANITDPSAISFCNTYVRRAADLYMQLYNLSKQANTDFTAKNLGPLIPNDSSLVVDGSAIDGRTQITGANVNVLLAHMNTLISDLEASSNLKRNQIDLVAVNPLP